MKILFTLIAALIFYPLISSGQITLPNNAQLRSSSDLQTSSQNPYYVQNQSEDGGTGADNPRARNFQIVPCDGVENPATKEKEIVCDFDMLIIGVNRIIKFLLFLSIPLVGGMILYMGFKYLTANGDPGKLASAKKMFVPVALGLFWVLAAYIVVYTILDKLVADRIGDKDKKDVIFLDVK